MHKAESVEKLYPQNSSNTSRWGKGVTHRAGAFSPGITDSRRARANRSMRLSYAVAGMASLANAVRNQASSWVRATTSWLPRAIARTVALPAWISSSPRMTA